MSSGIVTYAAVGAGVAASLASLAGWLRTRAEVRALQQQQAQSKRMVMPPSVSDVERYAGAKARLRLLHRRTYLWGALGCLGLAGLIAGTVGVAGGFGREGNVTAAPAPLTVPAEAAPAVVPEVDGARALLVGLGRLCRAERRKCKGHRKDVGPIVASVCHFHPELCTPTELPAGLTAPSAREQAEAPRLPRPVLQTVVARAASGALTWEDVQLALP